MRFTLPLIFWYSYLRALVHPRRVVRKCRALYQNSAVQKAWQWSVGKLFVASLALFAAGIGAAGDPREYALGMVLMLMGGVVLFIYAFAWNGFENHPRWTRASRWFLGFGALLSAPVSIVWMMAYKPPADPWTNLAKVFQDSPKPAPISHIDKIERRSVQKGSSPDATPGGRTLEVTPRAVSADPLQRRKQIPEASLRFKNAEDPSVVLFNSGTALLREPRYNVILFDLDTARPDQKGTVPVLRVNTPGFSQSDWLKVGHGFGSYRLFSDGHKPKPMTRVFGWITAMCPTCETDRTYIIFLNFTKDGWYYELPKGQSHNWEFFKQLFGLTSTEQTQLIEKAIPESVRVWIQ